MDKKGVSKKVSFIFLILSIIFVLGVNANAIDIPNILNFSDNNSEDVNDQINLTEEDLNKSLEVDETKEIILDDLNEEKIGKDGKIILSDSNEEEITDSKQNETKEIVLDTSDKNKKGKIVQSIMDIEDLDLIQRGFTYNAYKNSSNGKKTMRIYSTPINYKDNLGKFELIDTNIVKDGCEYDYCVRKGIYYADFKESSKSEEIVKFFYNNSFITYTPMNLVYVGGDGEDVIFTPKNVNGRANGSEFFYDGFYGKGFDLGYEYGKTFLKENLIIESKDILPIPKLGDNVYLSMDFKINTRSIEKESIIDEKGKLKNIEKLVDNEIFIDGKIVEKIKKKNGEELKEIIKKDFKWDENKELIFKGKADFKKLNGDLAFTLPKPYAVDANGSMVELEYKFMKKDGYIIVSVLTPYGWLIDEERVYPVKIDPSVETGDYIKSKIHVRKETTLPLCDPQGTWDYDTNSGVWTGYDDYACDSISRSVVYFDFTSDFRSWEVNSISNSRVDLRIYHVGDDNPYFYFGLYNGDKFSGSLSDTYSRIKRGSYSGSISEGSYTLTNLDNNEVGYALNNDKVLHLHLRGNEYEGDNEVKFDYDDFVLKFNYECSQIPGCNIDCDLDLDNGESCDCYQECDNGWCWGNSVNNYDCASGCASDGKYAPTSSECCNDWNSGTKRCYTECTPTSGCDSCLNLANGQDCDCDDECDNNYCWGNSVNNYDCSSNCVPEGKYTPESNDCCSGLTWNSGTKECYDACVETGGCDTCLNKANGLDCDCAGECSASYCKGNSANNYDCSSYCASDGQYAPSSNDCCNDWNSGTKKCYTDASCNYPDGSSFASGCDCDDDGDCDSGDYCEQGPDADACVEIPYCDGIIQVITENSQGEGMGGVDVYVNSVKEGTTSSSGVYSHSLDNSICGNSNSIDVKCEDNTFCSSGTVSIDYDGEEEGIVFDCTMCDKEQDLFISQKDVTVSKVGSGGRVTVNINSLNLGVSNLKVKFELVGIDGFVGETVIKTVSINSNSEVTSVADFSSFQGIMYVQVYVDYENQVEEVKTNNFVRRIVSFRPNAYFDVNTDIPKVDLVIEEFLGVYFNSVSEAEADTIISVGRNSQNFKADVSGVGNVGGGGWGYLNNLVYFGGRFIERPYAGIVGSYKKNGETIVSLFGNDVDGDIAALKKFAAAGRIYYEQDFDLMPTLVIDDYDLTGIQVYDVLHNLENVENYKQNTAEFAEAVSKVLNGNSYDVAIRLVETTNAEPTTLRIKNVNSDFSNNYKEAILNDTTPVVMSGGIFSDIGAWEGGGTKNNPALAIQLVQDGHDVWEIEMTGGAMAEDESAPDYTYEDLVDYYWPASIGAIQYYTDEDSIKYVGHSNGCRVALSSLARYQESGKSEVGVVQDLMTGNDVTVDLEGDSNAHVVDTFVGVACPATLNDWTPLGYVTRYEFEDSPIPSSNGRKFGEVGMEAVEGKHVLNEVVARKFLSVWAENGGDGISPLRDWILDKAYKSAGGTKISRNLMDFYINLYMEENSEFDLNELEVNKFRLHYVESNPVPYLMDHDFAVPLEDLDIILDQIISEDKDDEVYRFNPFKNRWLPNHDSILNEGDFKENVVEELR